jgi:hypothetical protein
LRPRHEKQLNDFGKFQLPAHNPLMDIAKAKEPVEATDLMLKLNASNLIIYLTYCSFDETNSRQN